MEGGVDKHPLGSRRVNCLWMYIHCTLQNNELSINYGFKGWMSYFYFASIQLSMCMGRFTMTDEMKVTQFGRLLIICAIRYSEKFLYILSKTCL
jgi:hypothetical protein